MKKLLLVLTLFATTLVAQTTTTPAAPANTPRPPQRPQEQLDAMAKLEYMAGRWVGTGWMDIGGTRMPFNGSELVTRKLDGLALLVEGDFYTGGGSLGGGTPVHQTLGVITYDPKAKAYRFSSWLATGTSGERELTLTSNGWSWDIKMPNNHTRYTFTLTPQGEWLEKGERSTDNGATWKQFFEMKLAREL
jgi:hypothetical protein